MKNLAIVILSAFLVLALFRVHALSNAEKSAFMDGCKQDMKEYECMVLWNQNNPHL